jgi:hypothetical protein
MRSKGNENRDENKDENRDENKDENKDEKLVSLLHTMKYFYAICLY